MPFLCQPERHQAMLEESHVLMQRFSFVPNCWGGGQIANFEKKPQVQSIIIREWPKDTPSPPTPQPPPPHTHTPILRNSDNFPPDTFYPTSPTIWDDRVTGINALESEFLEYQATLDDEFMTYFDQDNNLMHNDHKWHLQKLICNLVKLVLNTL